MNEVAYTVIWAPAATEDLRRLDKDELFDVLNNVITLARTPRPPFSGEVPGGDGLFMLVVGTVTVTYEVIGLSVVILGVRRAR